MEKYSWQGLGEYDRLAPPRQARLDISGVPYHIMVRGINNSTILRDDQDRMQLARWASTLKNEDWVNWWVSLAEVAGHVGMSTSGVARAIKQ
jgi:hypothetical protein